MSAAKRGVLNVSADTQAEVRKLAGQIQADTGENMTDEKTIRFLLRAREQLADRVTTEMEQAGAQ